jgi:Kdo2-lipid IVA lauroyltransferase/acyltransferase
LAEKHSPLRQRAEYAAVRLLLATLAHTPRGVASALAQFYAGLLDRFSPRLRRTGMRNLAFALPDLSKEQHHAIIDGVFRSIARMLLAFARFPHLNAANIHQWIRYEGFSHFEDALQGGKGVLFYTAHLGNWELSAVAHALMSKPMHVVVRPLDNVLLDELATAYRSHCGNRVIAKKDARPILRALAANEAVGVLADQNAAIEEGMFVDFFGMPACAHTGFARVAGHSRAPVIPGYALWSEQERRYILRFYPPIEMTGDPKEDTQRLHEQLESVIRQYPDQWLWIHRRWKTRPPGEASLY